jgi:hypothetical protein
MLIITNEIKEHLYNLINNYPIYWNNYFLFGEKKPTVIMYKNGVNFNCRSNNDNMVEEYIQLVTKAVNESIQNTNYFITTYNP